MGKNPKLIFGAAKCEVCFSNDLAKKILCLRPLYWMTMHIFPFISIACCFCDTCLCLKQCKHPKGIHRILESIGVKR